MKISKESKYQFLLKEWFWHQPFSKEYTDLGIIPFQKEAESLLERHMMERSFIESEIQESIKYEIGHK